MDLLKDPSFPYQKRLHNKGHLNLATEVLKGLSLGVYSRLCVTYRENSNNGNLKLKSRLITFFFLKEVLKAAVTNSNS